jgi:RNA-binding protein
MEILNSRQRAYLRTLSNGMDDTVQIGKGGFGASIAADIDRQLTIRELVKIHVLKTVEGDLREIAAQVAQECGASVVQVVGRKVVLYRYSEKRAQEGSAIQLP